MDSQDTLEAQAEVFARYLLDARPTSALVERWKAANRELFTDEPSSIDRSVVAFAIRHPRTLPWLDAAHGLIRPDGLLRRKVRVFCALLEASPEHVNDFAQKPRSLVGFVLELARIGLVAGIHAMLGLLILPFARRCRV